MQKKLTALFAFAIFVLLVGWAVTPAQAHDCSRHANQNHRHCPDGDPSPDGGGEATFSVEVEAGDGESNWVVAGENCGGLATKNVNVFSVGFPISVGCGQVHVTNGNLDLFLFQISVKNTKNETSALLFFSSVLVTHPGSPAPSEAVYQTDTLPGFVSLEGNGSIEVNALNINLTKGHQPDKGQVVGTISVGTIVFTPLE